MSVTTVSNETLVDRVEAPTSNLRLEYLDGLRGITALYVVFAHVGMYVPHLAGNHWLMLFTLWTTNGRSAVSIFIVLSGYCLMLPVARSNGKLKGGFSGFFKRRAKRILPPYYAALILGCLLSALAPRHWIAKDGWWQLMEPGLTPGSIITHCLLIHNLFSQWYVKINGPMWTVAMEWQIYFVFALVLLPVWRRFGVPATLFTAFAVGLAPLLLFHKFEWTDPWYVGLFAMGMTAACVNFSDASLMYKLRQYVYWLNTGSMLLALIIGVGLVGKIPAWGSSWKTLFMVDVIIGLAVSCLLIGCTQHLMEPHGRKRSIVLQMLQQPCVTKLGTFSYSLYLTHALTLVSVYPFVRILHLGEVIQFILFTLSAISLSILSSYIFHLLIEKPFMNTPITPKLDLSTAVVQERGTT